MPILQLTNAQITSRLYKYWDDNFPLAVTTVFPALKANTSDVSEWLELWVNSWSRRPHRATGNQLTDVTINVHVFVKPSTDKKRIHELTDAVQQTLTHAAIPIHDYETSGNPILGYLSLFEAEIRDLTRNQLNSLQQPLQHVIITIPGHTQPI